MIFWTKASPRPNTSRQTCDELVGVRSVRQVVGGEDERLGEAAVALARARRNDRGVFDDLAVGIRGRDLAFDFRRLELPLVFQQVELFGAGVGIDHARPARLPEEHAVEPHIGFDFDHIVIDQEAFADGALVFIAEDEVLEVGWWCGRRAWRSGRS